MKNIAIVCGGNSGEYEISINSAEVVKKHLPAKKYKSFIIEIKGSDWNHIDDNGNKIAVDKSDFSININNKKIEFDAVFNAIHGNPGEDGRLQAWFDMLNIPYTSCGVDASVLTFNKYYCNKFVNSFGIKTAPSLSFSKNESWNAEKIVDELGLPLFVKPVASGSSVGVSKAKNISQLKKAVKFAFEFDNRILIEKAIDGKEIACGVFKYNNGITVFPLTEIVSKNEFFDYDAKYSEGKAEEITPAPIDENNETKIKTLSTFLYNKMDCKGFVRFDYILTETELYFLEVNSIPGMSEASIIPKMAQAFGYSLERFFDMVVEEALLHG
jgi:D-alanine-D-alanine ligase